MFLALAGCGSSVNVSGPGSDDDVANQDTPIDSDYDGIADGDDACSETAFGHPTDGDGCALEQLDSDGDGLWDSQEGIIGTGPNDPDSDGDRLDDGLEIAIGYDPLSVDSDHDGLDDAGERNAGTSPFFRDTDADLLIDGAEVHDHGTNPLLPDSDRDGLLDGVEVDEFHGSNPLNPDTDADGFLDGEEWPLGLDLLLPNPIGVVVDVYCPNFVLVQSGSLEGVFEVYREGVSAFSLAFLPGDQVAFSAEILADDPIGPLRANLRTLEIGFGSWRGVLSGEGHRITDFRPGSLWPLYLSIQIVLANGLAWEVNSFDSRSANVLDWYVGDEIVIAEKVFEGVLLSQMINTNKCEMVLVSPG